jgi:GTP-binding protein Era
MFQIQRQALLLKSSGRRLAAVSCRQWRSSIPATRFLSTASNNDAQEPQKKRLDVAIVGAPNAGKSQLINILTQSPVAAVSRKRHTTRSGILGARTVENTQIVFKDTPGFLRIENAKEERLDRDLIVTASTEMKYVDYTLVVVDAARNLSENYRQALVLLMQHAVNSQGRIEEDYLEDDDADEEEENDTTKIKELDTVPKSKFAIVLNKVDLVNPKSELVDLAMEIGEIADECLQYHYRGQATPKEASQPLDFETLMEVAPVVFYVSALEEEGTDELLEHLLKLATPCNRWALPAGQVTDLAPLERVQEIIREKIYRCLHREVPHSITQVNRMFHLVPDGLVIHQELVVFTKSHQKLVLGVLERIQESGTRDLRKVFDCNVTLQLRVKLNKSKQRRDVEQYSHANY